MNARQTVTIQNPCILLCDFCDESKTLLSVVLFSFFIVFFLYQLLLLCVRACVCAFFFHVVFRRHFEHLNEKKNYLANEFSKKNICNIQIGFYIRQFYGVHLFFFCLNIAATVENKNTIFFYDEI